MMLLLAAVEFLWTWSMESCKPFRAFCFNSWGSDGKPLSACIPPVILAKR